MIVGVVVRYVVKFLSSKHSETGWQQHAVIKSRENSAKRLWGLTFSFYENGFVMHMYHSIEHISFEKKKALFS